MARVVRQLVLVFDVDEDSPLTVVELEDLGDRIVAQQVDPDPPVLTFDHVDVLTLVRD